MFKGNTDYISQTHAWLDFLVDLFSLPQGLKPFTLPSLSSTLLVSLPYITQGGCRVCAENNGRTLFHEWAHASCFTFIRGPIPAIKWESDAKTATPSTLFNVASSMKWKQKKLKEGAQCSWNLLFWYQLYYKSVHLFTSLFHLWCVSINLCFSVERSLLF